PTEPLFGPRRPETVEFRARHEACDVKGCRIGTAHGQAFRLRRCIDCRKHLPRLGVAVPIRQPILERCERASMSLPRVTSTPAADVPAGVFLWPGLTRP